jgi:FkbM family methyltransferase
VKKRHASEGSCSRAKAPPFLLFAGEDLSNNRADVLLAGPRGGAGSRRLQTEQQLMGVRHFLRVLARSRSLRFTIDSARALSLARAGVRSQPLEKFRWRGHDVFYRPATSDPLAINQVLLRKGGKAEYYLPPALAPRIILDIGSNIGTSILFFHEKFPTARIYGFEPNPDTFRILQRNVGAIPSVKIFNWALGAIDQKIALAFDGVDFSRFGAKDATESPIGTITTTECEAKHAGEVMKALALTEVDLIKIDCEGAEYDVLSALPEEMLRQCKWIVGEMHDLTAFNLLALLAPHFDLDLKKRMFVPSFRFHACNLACVRELQGSFDRNALQR